MYWVVASFTDTVTAQSTQAELPEALGQHTTSSGVRRSAVTRESSARTEAQDSSPELIEKNRLKHVCASIYREQQTASLFLGTVYCLYKW